MIQIIKIKIYIKIQIKQKIIKNNNINKNYNKNNDYSNNIKNNNQVTCLSHRNKTNYNLNNNINEFYDKNNNFQKFNEENIDDFNYDLSNSNSLTKMQFKTMIEMEQNEERKKKLIENNDHYLAVKLHNKELEIQMQQNLN